MFVNKTKYFQFNTRWSNVLVFICTFSHNNPRIEKHQDDDITTVCSWKTPVSLQSPPPGQLTAAPIGCRATSDTRGGEKHGGWKWLPSLCVPSTCALNCAGSHSGDWGLAQSMLGNQSLLKSQGFSRSTVYLHAAVRRSGSRSWEWKGSVDRPIGRRFIWTQSEHQRPLWSTRSRGTQRQSCSEWNHVI